MMWEQNKRTVVDVGTKQKTFVDAGTKKHSLIGIKNSIKFNDSMSWFPFAFDNVFSKIFAKDL